MNKEKEIVIIDSGIDLSSLENFEVDLSRIQGTTNNNFNKFDIDDVGHGTAIAYIFLKFTKNIPIRIINIFKNEFTEEIQLIRALEYVKTNYKNIYLVHISSGITAPKNKLYLHKLCKDITTNNVVIVSALDNFGVLSYPAAFDEVLSVAISSLCNSIWDFKTGEKFIDFYGYSGNQYLPWKNKRMKTVSGSSFIAPYISIGIINEIKNDLNIEEIRKKLKNKFSPLKSEKKLNSYVKERINQKHFNPEEAVIFPLQKETKNLLLNQDLLNFKIVSCFDIYDSFLDIRNEKIKILNIKEIKKANYKTLILGHLDKLKIIFNEDILKEFLDFGLKYHKNIYCFDSLKRYKKYFKKYHENNLKLFSAEDYIDYSHDVHDEYLNNFPMPILAICGTSPHQGKYTLQLNLRREFIKMGYRIGQIGTEPTSLLFEMDNMVCTGYTSNKMVNNYEIIPYYNSMFNGLTEKEIVIVGTQSHIMPYNFGNLNFYPFAQQYLMMAAQADAVILCINANDDLDYINRTIRYMESYFETFIILLAIYPFYKEKDWLIKYENREMGNRKKEFLKEKIEKKTGKKTYIINEIEEIRNEIINYFE